MLSQRAAAEQQGGWMCLARFYGESNSFVLLDSYDVGLTDEAGRSTFNPPLLRGVGLRNSSFHDGRVGSLEEVSSKYRHQIEETLSEGELRDLANFLRSL